MIVAVTAGLAMVMPAPAFAAPAAKRLTVSLLVEKDLPGYQLLMDGIDVQVLGLNTDADFCDRSPSANPGKTATAETSFVKTNSTVGPMIIEDLTVTGSATKARAIVAALAAAPQKCPTIKIDLFGEPAVMKLKPLRVPRLGDAAAGITFTFKYPSLKGTGTGRGTLITVAYQGISVNILMTGARQQDLTDAATIAVATTATRKLQRTR